MFFGAWCRGLACWRVVAGQVALVLVGVRHTSGIDVPVQQPLLELFADGLRLAIIDQVGALQRIIATVVELALAAGA